MNEEYIGETLYDLNNELNRLTAEEASLNEQLKGLEEQNAYEER